MKIIELTCPNCRGHIKHNKEESLLICEYCGYRALIEEDKDNNIKFIEQKTYAKVRGAYRAKAEHDVRTMFQKIILGLILIGLVLAVGYFYNAYQVSKLPEIDPFEYIEVSFSGLTGRGEAEIIYKAEDLDYNLYDIDYEISKDEFLKEGETLVVTASSDAFRLTKDMEKYKVEGLDVYLDDIDKITEANIETIIEGAGDEVHSDIASLPYTFKSFEMEPVKLYFLSNGQNENFLVCVFKVEYILKGGSKAYNYMVAAYDNVVVRGVGEKSTITYKVNFFDGDVMQIKSDTEYGPYLFAFETLEGAKSKIMTSRAANMKFQEKDL